MIVVGLQTLPMPKLWPRPCLSPMTLVCSCGLAVGFRFCFLLRALHPKFLRLVTVDFDTGWSYAMNNSGPCLTLSYVVSIYQLILSVSEMWYKCRPQCFCPLLKVFLCAYDSWQISTMPFSNNLPLDMYFVWSYNWLGWINSHTLVGTGHNPATFFLK